MTTDDARAAFRELHRPGDPLVMANAWDVGSARLFAALGFRALATTSSGHAATLGRLDGGVTSAEAIEHTAVMAAATPLPVNADLEDCFADEPAGVAATIAAAAGAGAAGASVEDYTRDRSRPIHDLALARERVAAAVEAARPSGLVVTARAENLIRGVEDLADTIARLQAYQEAGADVLFAPGLRSVEDIRAVVSALDRPVNVLLSPGGPDRDAVADAGAARISVGGSLAWVGWHAVADAARALLESGRPPDADAVRAGVAAIRSAFAPSSA